MSDAFRALIDTFGQGWKRGDVDTVCSVFTDDAAFLETPFSQEDRGLPAIRAYWKDIPLHHRRTGERVDARGAIFCETKDGKISEMRMYWHRYAGGREEPKP